MNLLKYFLLFVLYCNSANAQTPNTWVQKASLPNLGRYGAFAFSIGNKGYVGGGYSGFGKFLKDFWEYDSATDVWLQKNDFPFGKRGFGISFSWNGKGYIGLGKDSVNSTYPTDLWEYEPTQDTWIQKSNFPGIGRLDAINFVIDSIVYLGTGVSVLGFPQGDFWAYYIKADTWLQKANFGGGQVYGASYFASTTKGYILTGSNNSVLTSTQNVWEYNPLNNLWQQKNNFTGTARINAIGLNVSGHLYLGGGVIADSSPLNPLGFNYTKDFWEYFPNYDAWILKDSMPIASSDMSAFAINDRGYFCNGYNNDKNTFYKTIYEYTPDTLSYVNGAELIEKNSIFNKIILYPNPCNDKLLINSNNYLLNSIEITDMLGRNKTSTFQCKNQNEIIVDVSTLPKGIYFLKITDFNNQPTFKQFVKQ